MKFNTMVNDITIEDGRATAVTLEDGMVYEADEIVSAVGREGADWFSHICNGHGIETEVGTVDIGPRGSPRRGHGVPEQEPVRGKTRLLYPDF